MWKRLSDGIQRISTGWVTLAALVFFLAFTALVLPRQAAQAEADAGGADSPDMSFFYSAAELYDMAKAYGSEGRAAYVRARFTFDLVWPLVYTVFLCTSISWVYARAFPRHSAWQRANLAPLLGALFDYLENLSTSLVMLRYPAQTAVVDWLAPIWTLIKWILVYGSFALLVIGVAVGIISGIWRRIKKRRA